MKKLSDFLIKEEEETSSISADSVDFEEYLDNINDMIGDVQQEIQKFIDNAGNIADNDLSNKQKAIKDYIDELNNKLDELDEIKDDLNKQHSVDVL